MLRRTILPSLRTTLGKYQLKSIRYRVTQPIKRLLVKDSTYAYLGLGTLGASAYFLGQIQNTVTIQSLQAEVKNDPPAEAKSVVSDSVSNKKDYSALLANNIFRAGIIYMLASSMPLVFYIALCLEFCLFLKNKNSYFFISMINDFSTDLYQIYLASKYSPENAADQTRFVQDEFINSLKFNPETTHLFSTAKQGLCYGFTLLWYSHHKLGKNLISEINNLKHAIDGNQPLTPQQKKLLQDIISIQTNSNNTEFVINASQQIKIGYRGFTRAFKRIFNPDDGFFLEHKDASTLVSQAERNRGALIGVITAKNRKDGRGHIIGLTANKINNKTCYKIFDSNHHEVNFDNAADAEKHIDKLTKANEIRTSRIYITQVKQGLFWKRVTAEVNIPSPACGRGLG